MDRGQLGRVEKQDQLGNPQGEKEEGEHIPPDTRPRTRHADDVTPEYGGNSTNDSDWGRMDGNVQGLLILLTDPGHVFQVGG